METWHRMWEKSLPIWIKNRKSLSGYLVMLSTMWRVCLFTLFEQNNFSCYYFFVVVCKWIDGTKKFFYLDFSLIWFTKYNRLNFLFCAKQLLLGSVHPFLKAFCLCLTDWKIRVFAFKWNPSIAWSGMSKSSSKTKWKQIDHWHNNWYGYSGLSIYLWKAKD